MARQTINRPTQTEVDVERQLALSPVNEVVSSFPLPDDATEEVKENQATPETLTYQPAPVRRDHFVVRMARRLKAIYDLASGLSIREPDPFLSAKVTARLDWINDW